MGIVLAWILCGAVGLPAAMLALECLVGARGCRAAGRPDDSPPFTVLMPAHQEAAGIAAIVKATLSQLRPCDTLLVVADNCTDDTGRIARSLGATVAERHDPSRRGKGFALEFGREIIAADPRFSRAKLILILDADCWPEEDALQRLTAAAAVSGSVIQGAYLLECPPDASAVVRASCFAFLVKNLVRQLALRRLTGAALLQGSGMAFPRAVFLQERWETRSLVEDLELGLRLLLRGIGVGFEPSARFRSAASSTAGTEGQRRRWEHGMLQVMGRFVPRLLLAGLGGRPRLLVLALDLMVPPTVLLGALSLGATVIAWVIAWASLPAILLLAVNASLGVAVGVAWWARGRAILPPSSLAAMARYIVWKLPILLQFVTRRERHWIRTERQS